MEAIPESGTRGGEEWTIVKESMKEGEQKQHRMKKGCKDDTSHTKTNALGLTFSKQQNFFSAVLDK